MTRLLFSPLGRLARAPFVLAWCAVAASWTVLVRSGLIVGMWFVLHRPEAASTAALVGDVVLGLVGLVAAWAILALAAKRLHDLGQSAFHLCWIAPLPSLGAALAPIDATISTILVAASLVTMGWLALASGDPTDNAFGPRPVGRRAQRA